MRKPTTILMGLFLAGMLLGACGKRGGSVCPNYATEPNSNPPISNGGGGRDGQACPVPR